MLTATAEIKTAQKILIVEDECEMCLVLNILLNDEEIELNHVKNLSDASDYLERNQPSFILLDNKLPDGFGVDFISYIKNHYPSIKIIMMTGNGSTKDVALANGADHFLEKPFTKQQLLGSIKKLSNK